MLGLVVSIVHDCFLSPPGYFPGVITWKQAVRTENIGSRVTDLLEVALRLRDLLRDGPVPRAQFHRVYEDPLTGALPPGGPPSVDTQRKHLERSRELLAEWGYPTDYRHGMVSVCGPGPTAESRTLALDGEQCRILARVRSILDELDPHRVPAIPTHALLVKEYRYAELELTLADGRIVAGTNYETRVGATTQLHLRTSMGDVAVPAEGITRLVVLSRRTTIDFQGSPTPELLEVPDAVELRFDLRQGRPSHVVELVHAQAVIADLETRLPRSSDEEAALSFDAIAALTGQSVEFIRTNANRICMLDPSFIVENDGLVRLPFCDAGAEPLSGSAALVALHDIITFAALGAARSLLMTTPTDLDVLDDCRDELEEFLTLARMEIEMPKAPCADVVMRALLEGDAIFVATPTGKHRLVPTGLHWHAGRWWVLGASDDVPLLDGQLALDAIANIS